MLVLWYRLYTLTWWCLTIEAWMILTLSKDQQQHTTLHHRCSDHDQWPWCHHVCDSQHCIVTSSRWYHQPAWSTSSASWLPYLASFLVSVQTPVRDNPEILCLRKWWWGPRSLVQWTEMPALWWEEEYWRERLYKQEMGQQVVVMAWIWLYYSSILHTREPWGRQRDGVLPLCPGGRRPVCWHSQDSSLHLWRVQEDWSVWRQVSVPT